MVSLKIFILENINKADFMKVVQDYNEPTGEINYLKLKLRSSIENFEDLSDDLVYFEFQHDFKHEMKMRGEIVEYPFYHQANFWVLFAKKRNYIFAEGEDKSINYLLDELIKIVADKKLSREIIITPLELTNDIFTQILIEDALVIYSAWFGRLGERIQSAFLSGTLKDQDGRESADYKSFKKRAQQQTSTRFQSKFLGYMVGISRNSHALTSKIAEATQESLISYFKEIIHPILNVS